MKNVEIRLTFNYNLDPPASIPGKLKYLRFEVEDDSASHDKLWLLLKKHHLTIDYLVIRMSSETINQDSLFFPELRFFALDGPPIWYSSFFEGSCPKLEEITFENQYVEYANFRVDLSVVPNLTEIRIENGELALSKSDEASEKPVNLKSVEVVGQFLDIVGDGVRFVEELRFDEPELETDEDLNALKNCVKSLQDKSSRLKEIFVEGLKIAGDDGSLANVDICFSSKKILVMEGHVLPDSGYDEDHEGKFPSAMEYCAQFYSGLEFDTDVSNDVHAFFQAMERFKTPSILSFH